MPNSDKILSTTYPVVDGIVRALKKEDVTGRNKRYQGLYDGIARFYTPIQKVTEFFFYKVLRKQKEHPLLPFLAKLDIKPGDHVLEVSIGTGDNLETLPKDIEFYGLDISLGMLKQCLKRHGTSRSLILVHGMAEALPFNDESFDVVFHVGGINFFNDQAKAIQEMIRVARPGTRFLIADETEKVAKASERIPLIRRFFKNRDKVIVPPIDLIPKTMRDVKLSYVGNEDLYIITFIKP